MKVKHLAQFEFDCSNMSQDSWDMGNSNRLENKAALKSNILKKYFTVQNAPMRLEECEEISVHTGTKG